eukprot:TRINITY_DN32579_c0_g1_i1.p1 TRINITY_DN32579_c0_g1~~TRINITY_DN32579_c0_g1_i1.p1  ORF type:complete len:182 (+),score=14.97 TRINITY_DN32579_c0_g1_i1:28-546(+)
MSVEPGPDPASPVVFGQIAEPFLNGLVEVLQSFISSNSVSGTEHRTVFYLAKVPAISIEKYVIRLAKHFGCSKEDMIVAVILVDRLLYNQPTFRFTQHTFHRLFLTALLLSVKSRQDFFFNNLFYANVGGVRLKDMNIMEEHFLLALDFDTWVDEEAFAAFTSALGERFAIG